MAQAILDLYPGTQLAIGPPVEFGFYYDVELPEGKTLSDDDLAQIEGRMQEIVKADQAFQRHELPAAEAVAFFADEPYKAEIIERVTSGAGSGEDAGEIGGGDSISHSRVSSMRGATTSGVTPSSAVSRTSGGSSSTT